MKDILLESVVRPGFLPHRPCDLGRDSGPSTLWQISTGFAFLARLPLPGQTLQGVWWLLFNHRGTWDLGRLLRSGRPRALLDSKAATSRVTVLCPPLPHVRSWCFFIGQKVSGAKL